MAILWSLKCVAVILFKTYQIYKKDNNNSRRATYKIKSKHIKLQTSGSSHRSKKEAHTQRKKTENTAKIKKN